ncbi:MAG: methyltransferase domain-containing protein [Proteobacteria bacterium]|nr:methyltransferase domain-containing protein [Pseudomonadota bacterium]
MTSKMATKLNVGCGQDIRDGYVNIDGADLPGIDFVVDLDACATTRLPLPDDHFQQLELSHVLEHLRNPLALMQELYRVAAPGARLQVKVPHGGHDDAWVDPTHVRAIVPQTFSYFAQPKYVDFDYGYTGDWRVERCDVLVPRQIYDRIGRDKILEAVVIYRNVAKEIIVDLVAEKPARPRDPALDQPVVYQIVPF